MLIRYAVPALAALMLATPLLADQVTGTLDGEKREWHTLRSADASTVNFRELMPGMYGMTIQGHREARFETQGTLSIDFMVMNDVPNGVTVMYFPESGMTPHYTLEQVERVSFDRLEIDGDTARIVGSLEGALMHVASMTSDPDPSDTIELSVRFDVEARREE
ncbi:hypothetical protein [Billgrantia kenyensis]|uniref:Uncharacterized protein n=2 Tax=Billgrantia kenyensis TaxID=321266 RepID=A0A7V9W080_9GAMM|nr:hypothetical protein [Halomonas kenyensis]MBA2778680.1 hypothetical protein [Halomonas kenyensis]MCG6661516.1 hypothetical protein [Halomonas kenyensis]